ncbi:MAG: response regulator transcription factor [Salinivirgaceae bacterium]|nr:response regulator transcription factor [Salinivirgaceae bacterium]
MNDTQVENIYLQKLPIPSAKGTVFVNYTDIIYLEADSNYTNIYGINGFKIRSSYTLKIFQEKLPANQFVRCHSSVLINISFIFKINKKDKVCTLMAENEISVPISRKGMQLLDKFL